MGNTGVNSKSYKSSGGKLSNPTGKKVVGQPSLSSSSSSSSASKNNSSSTTTSTSSSSSSGSISEKKALLKRVESGDSAAVTEYNSKYGASAPGGNDQANSIIKRNAELIASGEAVTVGGKIYVNSPENTALTKALAEQNRINEEANQNQYDELNSILDETSQVDLSKSTDLVGQLITSLQEKEELPSLVDTYNKKRQEMGIDELESNLSDLDAQINDLDAEFSSTVEGTEQQRAPMGSIRRNLSETELQYNRQRGKLLAEKTSLANELSMKYSTIETMVSLMGQDITNAQNEYNSRFSQALQLTNLLNDMEDQKVNNARAGLQVMTNLLKEGNIDYSQLSDIQKADIRKMEITAGMPSGMTEFIKVATANPIVSYLSQYTNENGDLIQPVATRSADGTVSIKNINIGRELSNSDDSSNESENYTSGNTGMRTDRHNNPIAVAVTKNGTNQFTKALDNAGIKWSYGDAFSDNSKMVTIKINGDGIEASRVILSETNAIQGWYIKSTGKSILKKYKVTDNEDFKNLSVEEQDAIIKGIYIAEGGSGELFNPKSSTSSSSKAISKAEFIQILKEKSGGQLPGNTVVDTMYQAYLAQL